MSCDFFNENRVVIKNPDYRFSKIQNYTNRYDRVLLKSSKIKFGVLSDREYTKSHFCKLVEFYFSEILIKHKTDFSKFILFEYKKNSYFPLGLIKGYNDSGDKLFLTLNDIEGVGPNDERIRLSKFSVINLEKKVDDYLIDMNINFGYPTYKVSKFNFGLNYRGLNIDRKILESKLYSQRDKFNRFYLKDL